MRCNEIFFFLAGPATGYNGLSNIWVRLYRHCPGAAVVCCLLHIFLIKKLSRGYNHYKLQTQIDYLA